MLAGDWIKIETTTPDKPEVWQIADETGLDPDAVVGKLIRVWAWADQQVYDGDGNLRLAGGEDMKRTERYICNAFVTLARAVNRLTNVQGFAEAMKNAGWLVDKGGSIEFPNFDRHNGQTAKRRALTAKRVRDYRGEKVKRSERYKSVTREEKRRGSSRVKDPSERSSSKKKDPVRDLIVALEWPASLDNDVSKEALTEWMVEKRKRGQGYKTTKGPQAILNAFADLGAESLRAAVGESLKNNWAGVFPHDNRNGKTNRPGRGQVHDPDYADDSI